MRISEYQLVKEIGRGAMGSIYQARDTLLERDVALKQIAAAELDSEAKSSFFREARALARVSHPNVVIVHRVGETESGPYLVTELVEGSSLEALPKPIAWQRAVSLGIGIARGLAAAHRKNVLHRDIKPANIMLSDEGEPKLVDFGLAKLIEEAELARSPNGAGKSSGARFSRISKSGEMAGTPLYMAPETLFGSSATPQSDIYGVGAVLYELVTGVAPRDTLPEDLPLEAWITHAPTPIEALSPTRVDPRFVHLIMRCLDPSAASRFPTADALIDALDALREDEAQEEAPTGNPYRGLMPFDAEHRGVFFGRDAEVRAALVRLREESLLVVAGDSGVGKSSLCKAGVMPRLLHEATERGRRLCVLSLVPGQAPVHALSGALGQVLEKGVDFLSLLQAEADHAALYREVVRALQPQEDLLLFVDQMEELCTLSEASEAERFGEALMRVLSGPRVRVLATLRGDFITQIARFSSLGPALSKSLFLLRPMSEEGIRSAIVKPALRKGVTFESEELVDDLVRASVEMPGGLPLLEFALAEIWEARSEGSPVLTKRDLRSIGSISGALARHADAVLASLSVAERAAAKRVLLKLTHASRTRARRTLEELSGDDPATRAAIDALVRGRLIVARKRGDEEGVYEFAHEALLREWQTLRAWLEETREQGQFLQEIEEAAELWARRGRREEETWAGDALAQATKRVERWQLDLPMVSRSFLRAGVERQQKALRKRRLVLGGSAAVLVAIALVSTGAAIAFAEKEREAIRQQEQIRLAAADMGEFDLVLEPFDWDEKTQTKKPTNVPESLDFRLYKGSATDARAPGKPFGADDMRRGERRVEGQALREHVEARSGPAILEIMGRGEGCQSSFLYLRRLPGYTERISKGMTEIRIAVPSCQATKEGMVEIPAGPFIRSTRPADLSTDWSHETVELSAFLFDRTEVTRGAFSMYAAMEALTGDAAAPSAYLSQDRVGGERLPIVGVNAYTARSYCRFMGKELPTIDQWLKVLRGG